VGREGSIPFTRSFNLSIMTYLFQLTEISVSPNRSVLIATLINGNDVDARTANLAVLGVFALPKIPLNKVGNRRCLIVRMQ
jgi:hypothetical protein